MGFEVKCVRVLDRMPCLCCSCDLKVGTCILGWFVLIAHVGNFLRSAVGLVMFEDLKDVPPQDTPAALSSVLIVSAIGVLVSGLLLYGAHNERPGFMLPFVILQMTGIVFSALCVVGGSILLFTVDIVAGFLMLGLGGLFHLILSAGWLSTVTIGNLKNTAMHIVESVLILLLLGKQVSIHNHIQKWGPESV